MSRAYSVGLTVSSIEPGEVHVVLAAIESELYTVIDIKKKDNHNYSCDSCQLIVYNTDSSIGGGQSENDKAVEISKAIWSALGRWVHIVVNMLCLEDLPYEEYEMDEETYQKIIADRLEGSK